MTVTRDWVHRLPKAELHIHLDGCLRPATMLELGAAQGLKPIAASSDEVARKMFVGHANSLEEYLERYEFTLAVMQTAEALERIAYEFVIDSAADNVRYVETRYCPALHARQGLTLAGVQEATLAGLRRGEAETGTIARLIVCGLRTLPPSVSLDMAKLAVDYRDAGVVAFDLAGAEAGHPASEHVRAFEHALGHDLACTCHAGEGAGAESIDEALHVCRCRRIGHGTRLFEDSALEDEVIERRVPLEVCLTSNLHTGTVAHLAQHPLRRYLDRGAIVTLNCDSRLMDGIRLSDEYWAAHTALGCDREELVRIALNAVDSGFLEERAKADLGARFRREIQEMT